jgi:tetratricopeptide (TPR) repeat protein
MFRSAKALLIVVAVGCAALAQTPQTPAETSVAPDNQAGAYYHFAMGRLYEGLAELEGTKNDYIPQAIEHFQQALKLDPGSSIILEELTDLYVQSGQLRSAVAQAEELLKQDPDNLEARRMLGRIYMRALGNAPDGRINEETLRSAIQQYQKITEKDPKDVESWVMLARLYRASNNSVEAEKAFDAALKADPDNEEALTGLAMLYSDLGDTSRAIEKLKAATDKAPNEHTLAALASAYEQSRDYKNAAAALRRAVEIAPDNPRLVEGLAEDLLYSEQLDEALKLYQQIASEDSREARPQVRIAQIYRAKHEYDKAQEALAKAKALEPDDMEMQFEQINLLEAQGKSSDAIAALKTLLDQTAKKSYSTGESSYRATLLERLGQLYRTNLQYAPAVDAFRQAITLEPSGAGRFSIEVVETYRAAKDMESAQREADAALKKFPTERIVVVEHATVLADQGKIDAAAAEVRALPKDRPRETALTLAQLYEKGKRWQDMGKALDEAEKLSESNDDKETVQFMRGAMYERMKRYDAAEAEFRKVIELNPENAGALNYLGYMLADRNAKLDEASRLIKKAVELEPENGAYLDSLGWVYYRQDRLNDAEGLLVRALDRIGGQDPTVHDHLGDVYFKLGKTREAIAQWQASLKEFQGGSPTDIDPDEMAKVSKKLEGARTRLAQETKKQ